MTKIKKKTIWLAFLSLILIFGGFRGFSAVSKVQAGATTIDPADQRINVTNALVIAKDVETSAVDVQITGSSPQIKRLTGNDRPWNMTDSDATQVSFSSPSEMANSVINVKYAKPVGTYGSGNDSVPIYAQLKIHDIKAQPSPPQYGSDYLSWDFSDKLYNGIQANGEQQFHVDLTFTNASGTPIDVGEGTYTTWVTLNSLNQATASATNGSFNHIVTGNEFASYEKMGSLPYYKTNDSILKGYSSPWSNTAVIGGNRSAKSVKDSVQTDLGFPDILGYKDFTKASASFQVQGSTLKFVIGNYADSTEDNKANGGAYGYLNGQWTAFSSATLWNPIPVAPTKDVMQNNTDDPTNLANFHSINKQEAQPNEKFEFTVSQPVGVMNVSILNKYDTFEFTDKLSDDVTYLKNGYVTNSDGARLPDDAGSFTYEDGILKYAFSADYLANQMPYKGETYTIHVPVQVNSDVKPGTVIQNTAHTQINKDKGTTNETSNPVGEDPGTSVVKKIFAGKFDSVKDWDGLFKDVSKAGSSDTDTIKSQSQDATKTLKKSLTKSSDGDYDGSDALKDEQQMTGKDDTTDINFAMQFKLSKYGDFSTLVLTDNLKEAFNFKSAKVLDSKGKDITNDGVLNTGSSKRDITWTSKDPESLRGQDIYLYLTVNLNKDFKYTADQIDSQTGNYIIPNDASIQVGQDTYPSNQVHVVIPNPNGLIPNPVKAVVDSNGSDINHVEAANGDTITYYVSQTVGNLGNDLLKPYKSFSISDKLDPNLKYVNSYVINKDSGKKISDSNSTEYDEKTRTVSWTASQDFLDKGMKLNGETYSLVIEAKVDNSTALENTINGDSQAKPGDQVVIKNVGQSTINDTPRDSNEVENPLKPKDVVKPTKTDVDANGKDFSNHTVYKDNMIYYNIDQNVGTLGKDLVSRYKSFSISDKLDQNLDYVKAYVIDKSSKKEVSDPSSIEFNQDQNLVTWTASDEFLQSMPLKGETYELVIEAKVNGTQSADKIVNTATSNVDGNPQLTNEVSNPLNHENPAPTKSVVNKDGKDIDNATVKYGKDGDTLYYHVDQNVGTLNKDLTGRYSDFKIKDALDKRLVYQNAYVIDKKTGKKVSQPSELTFEPASNTVLFTASKNFLDEMDLKGETYELVIEVKVKGNENADNQDNKDNSKSTETDSKSNDSETEDANSDDSQETAQTQDSNNDSDSEGENDIVNVATSTLNGNSLDTNEVRNKLEPEKNSNPDSNPDSPQDDKKADDTPEDAPSYKKMAQTGAKQSQNWFESLIQHVLAFFQNQK